MAIGKHIRDTFISAMALFGIVRLYRTTRRGPLVRVLVFHDVPDAAWFESVVTFLCEHYNVITPDAFKDGDLEKEKINVLVTFDDAYASWRSVALPILKKYGVKSIFFINSGLVDIARDESAVASYMEERLLIRSRAALSWDDVRTLKAEGHAIGGHTVTHARLSTLPEDAQGNEIEADASRIAEMTGEKPIFFAYPFGNSGDYTDMTKSLVSEAGYEFAFTTAGTFADRTDRFAVARMGVEDEQTPASLGTWIDGGYDLYRKLKKVCAR